MPKYADLLKLDQDEKSYAALMRRNYRIANTPEVAKGGYSALAPVETVSAAVPRMATANTPAVGYSALAPDATVQNVSVPQLATETPTTDKTKTETTTTGYASLDPEYAKRVAQIENEYARSLPNYGVQAERMAQAGIYGGYSDYLQGVAYAQMQNAKENAYATYAEKAEAKRNESSARVNLLYTMLADSTYKDADGNDAQGYGLAYEMSDDAYSKAKEMLDVELQNKGVSSDEIAEAFARVDKARTNNVNRIRADAEQAVKGVTDGATSVEELYAKLGYTPSESDTEGSAFLNALNQGVEYGLISPASRSAALKENLSIYSTDDGGKSFDEQSWKQKGNDLYQSVKNAIDYGNEGLMEKGDVDAVVKDATAKLGFDSIKYEYNEGSKALNITLSNGNTLRADYGGAATADATNYLNANYKNLPLAMYNGQLYYQTTQTGKEIAGETRWYKLKTKKGSPGTPEEGDNYFKTIALIMMQNKDKYHLGLPEAESNAKWWGEGVQYADERKALKQIVYNIASGKVSYHDIYGNTLNSKAFE